MRIFASLKKERKDMKQIKNLVFDFGGVIFGLDRNQAVQAFQQIGVVDADRLLDPYHQQGIFLEVEDGRMDAETFRQALGRLCGKELTFEEVESGWKGFITEVPQYKLECLQALRKRYKVYILSNTNPYIMGWARGADFTPAGKPIDSYVDKVYASFEIGITKPDPGIFEYMIQDSGMDPEETLFIDDGPANIATAKAMGFLTLQTGNNEDWRPALEKML